MFCAVVLLSATFLVYQIAFALSRTFFKKFFEVVLAVFVSNFYSLTYCFLLVKNFFSKLFIKFVVLIDLLLSATCLYYHIRDWLSTTFFDFFLFILVVCVVLRQLLNNITVISQCQAFFYLIFAIHLQHYL